MGLHLLHTDRYGCSTQLLPAYLQVPHLHCISMYLFLRSETGFPITEIVLDTFVLHHIPSSWLQRGFLQPLCFIRNDFWPKDLPSECHTALHDGTRSWRLDDTRRQSLESPCPLTCYPGPQAPHSISWGLSCSCAADGLLCPILPPSPPYRGT